MYTSEYDTLVKESRSHGENNDCAVIAVAQATGHNYDICHKTMQSFGRKKKKGTNFERTVMPSVLVLSGCYLVDETDFYVGDKNATTINRLEAHCNKDEIYLVRTGGRTTGHLVCIKNGRSQDYTKGRRNKIKKVYKLSDDRS